jgi:hypothetical protein
MNEQLAAWRGYIVPHSGIATARDKAIVTMIGGASGDTRPGGIVEIDDKTGAVTIHFDPPPLRAANELGRRRPPLGQLRRGSEEVHRRPGWSSHDAVRSEHSAGARRALTARMDSGGRPAAAALSA